MLSTVRRILKAVHPAGIPWPGSFIYNAISKTEIFQSLYEEVAEDIISRCPEGSILDIGTGPGFLLIKLNRLNPGLQLTGLDISLAMVLTARRNVGDAGMSGIEIREGAAGNLPFPYSVFDAVVSTGSFHHWKDYEAGLNEVYRVLKPGGRALIYDIVSDIPESVLKDMSARYGRLRTALFRLHTFEEPFHSSEGLAAAARSSLFGEGRVRFVSVLCCLEMIKS